MWMSLATPLQDIQTSLTADNTKAKMAQGVWQRAPNCTLNSSDPKLMCSHGACRNKYDPRSQSPVLYPCSRWSEPSLIHSGSSTPHGLLIRLGSAKFGGQTDYVTSLRPLIMKWSVPFTPVVALLLRLIGVCANTNSKGTTYASVEFNGNVGIGISPVHTPSQRLGPFQTRPQRITLQPSQPCCRNQANYKTFGNYESFTFEVYESCAVAIRNWWTDDTYDKRTSHLSKAISLTLLSHISSGCERSGKWKNMWMKLTEF